VQRAVDLHRWLMGTPRRCHGAGPEASGVPFRSPAVRLGVPVSHLLLIAGVMAVVDHVPLRADARHQMVTLDQVSTDEDALVERLERLLGVVVASVTVQSTDLVRDSMVVDVRTG